MLHVSSLETFPIVLLTSFWVFFSLTLSLFEAKWSSISIMIDQLSSAPFFFFPLLLLLSLSLSSSLSSSSFRLLNRHITISLFFLNFLVDSFICQSNPHVNLSNPFPSSILLKVETFHSSSIQNLTSLRKEYSHITRGMSRGWCRLLLLFLALSCIFGVINASAGEADPVYK